MANFRQGLAGLASGIDKTAALNMNNPNKIKPKTGKASQGVTPDFVNAAAYTEAVTMKKAAERSQQMMAAQEQQEGQQGTIAQQMQQAAVGGSPGGARQNTAGIANQMQGVMQNNAAKGKQAQKAMQKMAMQKQKPKPVMQAQGQPRPQQRPPQQGGIGAMMPQQGRPQMPQQQQQMPVRRAAQGGLMRFQSGGTVKDRIIGDLEKALKGGASKTDIARDLKQLNLAGLETVPKYIAFLERMGKPEVAKLMADAPAQAAGSAPSADQLNAQPDLSKALAGIGSQKPVTEKISKPRNQQMLAQAAPTLPKREGLPGIKREDLKPNESPYTTDMYGNKVLRADVNKDINEKLRAKNVDPNARTAGTAINAAINYGSGPLVDKEGGGKRYMTQEERVAKQENEAGLKKAMADEDVQFGLEDDLEKLMADEDAQFAAEDAAGDTAGIDAQVQGVIEGGANPYAKVDAALAAAKGNAGESAGGLEIGSAARDLTKGNLQGLGALKDDGKVNPQPFKTEQEAARADSDKYYKRQANEDAYKKDRETRENFYGKYDPKADKQRQSEAFAAYVGRGKGGAAQGLQAQMQVRNAQSKAREGQMLGLEALGQKGREQDRLIADKGTSRYDSIGSNGTSILNAAVQGFSVASQQDMIAAREDLDRKDKTIARKMEANLAEAQLEMDKITAAGEASATQRKDVLSLIVTAEDNILKAKQDIFAVYEPQISMAQQQGKDTAALIDVRDKAIDGVVAGYTGVLTKLNEMAGVNRPNLSGSPYSESADVNSVVNDKLKKKQ